MSLIASTNDTTYTFRVRAVNAREPGPLVGEGDWSNEATARPTDTSGTQRSFTISATIDGKSWARAGSTDHDSRDGRGESEVHGAEHPAVGRRRWGRHSSERDEWSLGRRTAGGTSRSQSPRVRPATSLSRCSASPTDPLQADRPFQRLGGYQRGDPPRTTPDPPTGLEATRGDGEVTLSWATDPVPRPRPPPPRRLRVPAEAGTGFLWALDGVCGRRVPDNGNVTSNTVTGLTNGGTYAFQVRALAQHRRVSE